MNSILNYPLVTGYKERSRTGEIGFLLIITAFIALVLTFYFIVLVIIPKTQTVDIPSPTGLEKEVAYARR